MWEAGQFSELLTRAEVQVYIQKEDRRRRRSGGAAKLRARRARTLTYAGAYRKAVMSMTSQMADLNDDQQRLWASKLLPCSDRPDQAHAGHGTETSDELEDSGSWTKSLTGVKFSALSAPGHSGARPEHLMDAITVKPRMAASQLGRALARLHATARNGGLPTSARWILDSRLVFLRKKSGDTPRPVRVGELWRRVIAKKIAHDTRTEVRSLMLKARQFGIAIPGGADILIHLRSIFEESL
eukprot:1650100-Karenia_brevis.AAC.1